MDSFETYKQKILSFYDEARRMPTYKEFMSLTGFKSKNAVFKLINKFIDVEFLEKDTQGKLSPGSLFGFGEVKMLTQPVSAGYGAEVQDEIIDSVNLNEWLVHDAQKTFMLTVQGDSMIDAGIFDGDTVLVEKIYGGGSNISTGTTVVALLNDGYTVKYLQKKTKSGELFLMPANKNYKPIYSSEENQIQLVAVVKAVIRKM